MRRRHSFADLRSRRAENRSPAVTSQGGTRTRLHRKSLSFAAVMIVSAAFLAACSGGGSSSPSSASSVAPLGSLKGKTITVSTWGGTWTDAFKQAFAGPFSKATGAKFNYVINGSDPTVPVLLQEQANNVKIDLVDSGVGSQLKEKGYLEPFPSSLLDIMKKTSAPGMANPYWWTYGTVTKVIVCNPQIVARCPTTPAQFFDVKDYPGRRAVDSYPEEAIVEALEAAGVSQSQIQSNPPLSVAAKMLKQIKPSVAVWASTGEQMTDAMTSKEAGICLCWISSVVPSMLKGYGYWKVSWSGAQSQEDFAFLVPKGAPDASATYAFLEWIAEHPKNQAAFSQNQFTQTPGSAVLQYIPKSLVPYQPQSHSVFYWSSEWYSENSQQVQSLWESTVGA